MDPHQHMPPSVEADDCNRAVLVEHRVRIADWECFGAKKICPITPLRTVDPGSR
jgi:hypothetical protein